MSWKGKKLTASVPETTSDISVLEVVDSDPHDLEDVFNLIAAAPTSADGHISVGDVMDQFGRRSFGPVLLVIGLVAISPLTWIPTVPTTLGIVALLVGMQMFLDTDGIWLPNFLRRRHVSKARLVRALEATRPAARFIDKLSRPRMAVLSGEIAARVIALCCMTFGLLSPPMEFVPFIFIVPSWAIAAFGFALLTGDGVVALFGFSLAALTFGLAGHVLAMPF
jgi:hypothetical protein